MPIYLLNNTRKILHYIYKADIRLDNVQLCTKTPEVTYPEWGGLMEKKLTFVSFSLFLCIHCFYNQEAKTKQKSPIPITIPVSSLRLDITLKIKIVTFSTASVSSIVPYK